MLYQNDETPSQELIVLSNTQSIGGTLGREQQKFIPSIDQMIAVWLDAKLHRSGSERTVAEYSRQITKFRQVLLDAGIDLDGDPGLIATLAQGWVPRPIEPSLGRRVKSTEVAPQTYNSRITAIGSFYSFAMKRRWLLTNPMDMLEHRKIVSRDFAHPLSQEDIHFYLGKIDRRTLKGKRDCALIILALTTGRRRAELTALQWGDISFTGAGQATVLWRRCKGGKQMQDTLSDATVAALRDWMQAFHGADLHKIPPETPVWVGLSPIRPRNTPLSDTGIRRIWLKRLGTGKVHVARHTFATTMEQLNAPPSEIQRRLGHSNLSTTSVYLERMRAPQNPYASKLEETFVTPQAEFELSTRERVDEAIRTNPGMAGAEIARLVGVSESTVSRHRKALHRQSE